MLFDVQRLTERAEIIGTYGAYSEVGSFMESDLSLGFDRRKTSIVPIDDIFQSPRIPLEKKIIFARPVFTWNIKQLEVLQTYDVHLYNKTIDGFWRIKEDSLPFSHPGFKPITTRDGSKV